MQFRKPSRFIGWRPQSWTRNRRRLFSIPSGHWVSAVAFRDVGTSLLVVSGSVNAAGTVDVYECITGRKITTVIDRVAADLNAVFSPDRAWLAGSTGGFIGTVRLWRLESQQQP